jgi:hypothetical protein
MMPTSQTNDAAEAALAALLEQLWQIGREAPARPCSLARLGKRSGLRMSVLIRQLGFLQGQGWVELVLREEGGGNVALTSAGAQLCAQLFGDGAAG